MTYLYLSEDGSAHAEIAEEQQKGNARGVNKLSTKDPGPQVMVSMCGSIFKRR